MSARIEDYAIIGDGWSAALVSRDASIDWLCLPRFDSGACFAALLGTAANGRWVIRPQGAVRQQSRKYRGDTLILETMFETEQGSVAVIDLMTRHNDAPTVLRSVEGRGGRVTMRMDLALRLDYGSIIPWVRQTETGLIAIAGPDALRLHSDVRTRGVDFRTVAECDVYVQELDAVKETPHEFKMVAGSIGFAPPRVLADPESVNRAAGVLNAGKDIAILVGQGTPQCRRGRRSEALGLRPRGIARLCLPARFQPGPGNRLSSEASGHALRLPRGSRRLRARGDSLRGHRQVPPHWIHRWARLASWAPELANWISHAPLLSSVFKRAGGVATERDVPRFAPQSFQSWFRQRGERNAGGREVILWPDTFNNYFHPEIVRATVRVLEQAGCHVTVPAARLCCGRPLYDYGMLDLAKELLTDVLRELRPQIREGVAVVGLEPSCVSVFRDELKSLFPHDENALRLAAQTYDLSDFLVQHVNDYQPPKLHRKALVHGHCHHKAVLKFDSEQQLLERTGLPLIRPQVEGLPPRRGRAPDAGVPSEAKRGSPPEAPSREPERRGLGLQMGFSFDKPNDTSDWKQCPDCRVWVHGLDRDACPYCGFVFGQQASKPR